MRRSVCIAVFTLVLLQPLRAAAPSIVMVYGAGLEQPIYLIDWDENQSLMIALQDQRAFDTSVLTGRPFLGVAFFWGSRWQAHVVEKRPLSEIRADQTGHQGRLYPATATEPAVLVQTEPGPWPAMPPPDDLTRFTRGGRVPPDALAIFRSWRVPVEVIKR